MSVRVDMHSRIQSETDGRFNAVFAAVPKCCILIDIIDIIDIIESI